MVKRPNGIAPGATKDTAKGDPSPGGRRRLLRALGKGSFAALPVIWVRPIVQSTILPAHAQSSPTPVCSVGVTWANTSTENPVCLLFDGADQGCALNETETFSDSLPAGTYNVFFVWGGGPGTIQDFTYTVVCCGVGPTGFPAIVTPTHTGGGVPAAIFTVSDDGTCTVVFD